MLCLASGLGNQCVRLFHRGTDNTPSNFHTSEELTETMEGGGRTDNTPLHFHSPEEITETCEGPGNSFLPGMYKIALLQSIIKISCRNKLLVFRNITKYTNWQQSGIRCDIMTQQYYKVSVKELQISVRWAICASPIQLLTRNHKSNANCV